MVHCEDGRVSISCCVKRDTLARIHSGSDAGRGEAVLGYIMESCRGVRQALAGASRDGAWLAAGPIRPGIRLGSRHGIFPVGNAAAEAHPVVAEGISMAMQSAWLLAQRLIAWRVAGGAEGKLGEVALDYEADWRRRFAARLYASKLIAHWAMRPAAVATLAPLVRRFPRLLTWGARLSGKTTRVLAS
jgi:flavin-dependent dehydrogenase